MLTFKALNLEDINAIYAQESLEKNALNTFAKILAQYYANTQAKLAQNLTSKSTKFSERNLASNELAQFFSALGFDAQSEQESGADRANSAIDLALIKSSQTTKTISQVKTIIEAKLPENLTKNKQMFSPQNVNCKALHEAILYYLREVNDKQNYGVESIIITDFTRFFIFGYKEFERLFSKNAKIKEIFTRYKNDTSSFYAKAYDILETLDDEICGICVDLALLGEFSTQNIAQNLAPKIKKHLELLCKILHKDFLFNEFKLNNPLSPRFYNELLYILGLSEVDEKGREIKESKGGKILIKPSKESLSGQNTFYTVIASKLATHKKSNDLDFIMQYVILWLNRILFLKLIEANLIAFNNDRNLAFLNTSKIKDYQALSYLFFEILAKKPSERNLDSPLSFLPYLNSSLFEKQPCEEVLEISQLDNDAQFVYYATTQVRQDGKAKAGRVNLLSYIFEFLDAFDFGSGENDFLSGESIANKENSANIIEQKELIKTNVLGLVFEKLNGYKEGSFYTPNFITNYMCRTSLQKIVLDKFNEANPKWSAKNLADLRELIRDERERKIEFKSILRGVKICDPSVGSGHFLVSALCEMVRIYHELRLSDELNEYELKIDNDEIIIYVTKDMVFDYKKPSKPNDNNQAIQKSLFNLKKSIIESNLYGVDINPNSVEICKLRLWIELLKNSYYLLEGDEGYLSNLDSAIHQMQTLPNIDINIKCGNSLISRFSLQDSLKHIPNINKQITEYQQLVFDYKNSDKSELRASKKDIESKIAQLKATFRLTLKDPKTKQALEKALQNHIALYGNFLLDDESLLDGLQGQMGNLFGNETLSEEQQQNAAQSYASIKLLRHKLDSSLSGAEYKGAFEWRFEFPEVLDSNGDFTGFDLVIGNPPYIDYREINESTILSTKNYSASIDSIRPNIFCYFIEKGIEVLSTNGVLTFVNPIAMLQADFAYGTRKLLLEKGSIDYIADCSYIKAFDSASTYPALWKFTKNKKQDCIKIILWQDDRFTYSHDIQSYANNERYAININKHSIDFSRVDCVALGEIGTLKWGTSQSGYGKKKISLKSFKRLKRTSQDKYKPIIQTADIKKYCIVWQEEYIPTEIYSQNIQEDFKKPKIVVARMTKSIQASFDTNDFYMGKATLIVDCKENPYYILGILNSKVADFWYKYYFGATHLGSGYIRYDIPYLKQLPVPKVTAKNKKIADKIVSLVEKILKFKKQGADTTELEQEIDDLVYKLYGLADSEIDIINP